MRPRSRFCSRCEEWWPLGNVQCPACMKNTSSAQHRPTKTEQHAEFEKWCWNHNRQEQQKADVNG